MPKSKTEDVQRIAQRLALFPYSEIYEEIIIPTARRRRRASLAKAAIENLRRRVSLRLITLRGGRASHPAMTYYGLLLAAYYGLEAEISTPGNRRRGEVDPITIARRAAEIVMNVFRSQATF